MSSLVPLGRSGKPCRDSQSLRVTWVKCCKPLRPSTHLSPEQHSRSKCFSFPSFDRLGNISIYPQHVIFKDSRDSNSPRPCTSTSSCKSDRCKVSRFFKFDRSGIPTRDVHFSTDNSLKFSRCSRAGKCVIEQLETESFDRFLKLENCGSGVISVSFKVDKLDGSLWKDFKFFQSEKFLPLASAPMRIPVER